VRRALSAGGRLLRACIRSARRRRRLRIALLALLAALPLLAGAWLWFRQSPLVSVRSVQITGVHGFDAQAVDAALTQAAHGMSTLDVSAGALRAAVAPLRVVREVRAIPSFPHGLRIEVREQLPVASLTVAGLRSAVAADGVVLGPALLSGSLPSVSGPPSGEAAVMPAPGQRVGGAEVLGALSVLGAAPAALAGHVERVFTGAKGLTLAMRNGLLVYFGDDARPHAKWFSLARVLADPSSAGASYIDVRLPSHPAAGFPAGVSPPDASTAPGASTGAQPAGSESTVASLAAALPAAGAGDGTSSSSPATSSPEGESAATAGTQTGAGTLGGGAETQAGAQAPSGAGTETAAGGQGEAGPSAGATAGG
jgi:cell division protein FtsQ